MFHDEASGSFWLSSVLSKAVYYCGSVLCNPFSPWTVPADRP